MFNNRYKDIISVLLRNVLFLAAIYFVYNFGYAKFIGDIKDRNSLNEKYKVIYADLLNFVKLNENMYDTRAKIEDIINGIPVKFEQNQVLIVTYKDRVFEAATESKINITNYSIEKDEKTGMVTLKINFNAKYENTFRFLFAIEMFSIVKSVLIDENNDATVVSSPILYSSAVDNYFSGVKERMDDFRTSGYFKELFEKSSMALKTLGHVPSSRDIKLVPRSPFYEYIAPAPAVKTTAAVRPESRLPTIQISGIMYDSENPIVIIEGKLYRQGDTYKNVKIVNIRERDIVVSLEDKKYIVKFNREE
ncbi:MAG: general secretion pathway protein GspB [Endomicrobia bacterium]|nr:general secretion pathway protein GspB [Endomicrobiia bacterium]